MATRALILSLCLVTALLAVRRGSALEAVPLRAPLTALPWTVQGFDGRPAADFERAILEELGVDDYVNRVYRSDDGAELGLYVGYYESQRQGRTIHSPLNCLPGAGWEPHSRARVTIDVAGRPKPIEVNRYVVSQGLERLLILYWYQSRGRVVASEYWTKAFLVSDALRTGRTDGALVRIVSPLGELRDIDERGAERRAVSFVRSMFPFLDRHLPG
jgi:EpsI family protein